MNAVITISRQLGSLGSYIATDVARELDLRYLDREILYRLAEMAGYPDDDEMIQRLEKREYIDGILRQMLDALAALPPIPMVPSASLREIYAYDNAISALMQREDLSYQDALQRAERERQQEMLAADYAKLVQQVILEFAQEGDAVIVGRGGQVILSDMPDVLHVQIIAPESVRVQRLMERMDISKREAQEQIWQADGDRARYMKHFHNVDWRAPELYDVVINTRKLSVETVSAFLCEALRKMT
jgi:cytidylate kinase